MSDTPRTDKVTRTYEDASVEWEEELVPVEACRTIERKLNEMERLASVRLAYIQQLEAEKETSIKCIKHLEKVGKELRECANQLGWTSSNETQWIKRAEAAVKAWDETNNTKTY